MSLMASEMTSGEVTSGEVTSGEAAIAPSWQQTIEAAVAYLQARTGDAPATDAPTTDAIAQALLQAEKSARQSSEPQSRDFSAEQLSGHWRLGFITGTQKSRERAGVVLGAGRFLPAWVRITISYRFGALQDDGEEPVQEKTAQEKTVHEKAVKEKTAREGDVQNSVRCGPLNLTVSGPIRWFPRRRILAFDFPKMAIRLAGLPLFNGYIPKGQARESEFLADSSPRSLRNQAFFTYFWIQPNCIAARGRGGGLALWYREDSVT